MGSQVNLYRSGGEWCYAAWIDGEFDSSDAIGCDDELGEEAVKAYMHDNFTGWPSPVQYTRVADI